MSGHSKWHTIKLLVLVPDSHRCLSLSINKGHAARALALEMGDRVRLTLLDNAPELDTRRIGDARSSNAGA